MKKILLLATSLLLITYLSAQTHQLKFALGPTAAIPTGSLNEMVSPGIGLEATFLYPLTDKYTLFGNTGFAQFKGRNYENVANKNAFHVPVIAGVRYTHNAFFTGIGIGTGTWDFGRSGYSETRFAFTPQIGCSFKHFELTAKYYHTVMSGVNPAYFGFSAVYKF